MIKSLCTALVCALGTAYADTVRDLRPAELRGIRIWDENSSINEAPDRQGLIYLTRPRFKNETLFELASISVRLVVDEDGRQTYRSPAVWISKFDNYCVPHSGSLLPMEKSDISGPVSFRFQNELWNTHSHPHLEFVGAKTFVKTNLHDAGHLFAYFANTHDDAVIATLKKDPTLVKVTNSRGMSATLSAFAACGVPVVKYLLSQGGSTNPSTGGTTIMHMASVNPNPSMQDLALRFGGNVNARTKNGNPCLDKAIAMGARNCWRWLLAHKANPDVLDARGMTPGYMAISEGQPDAIKDLAKAGAHFRARDRQGLGWMEYAIYNQYMLPVVQSLGLSVNDRDPKTGRTVLMYAASTGYPDSEAWLIRHGANVNLQDKRGKTAYDYARLSNTLHTDSFFRDIVAKNSH